LFEFGREIEANFPTVAIRGYVDRQEGKEVDLDPQGEWGGFVAVGIRELHDSEVVLTGITMFLERIETPIATNAADFVEFLVEEFSYDRANLPEPWAERIDRVLHTARYTVDVTYPTGDRYDHALRRRIVWALDRWLVERCDGIVYYDGHGIVDPETRELIWDV
jgi:hypothetical protein